MDAAERDSDPLGPFTDAERARESALRERLEGLARPTGLLRFDRFVDEALYAEGLGFYASRAASIGPRGAFYTAPRVSPLFARAIAARLSEEHGRLGRPDPFTVVEVGAGDGTLAAGVIGELKRRGLPGVVYRLVERAPDLAAEALGRAAEAAAGSPIEVRPSGSVGAEGPFVGAVVANELLDALPFRRLVRRDGAWRELGVAVGPGPFTVEEMTGPAAPTDLALGPAPEGTIAEISPASEAFVREIGDHLEAGTALLIDYGEEEERLLGGHPRGTLAAVRHHRAAPDPLAHPGLLDLSAFVNFTRLRAAASRSGLSETAFRSQAEALLAWGLEASLDAEARAARGAEEEVRVRLAAKNLLVGFDRFKVLELAPPDATAGAARSGR